METATQTLHRLTSYAPGHAWDQPADDPRVVRDLQANDMARFPWFFKRYAGRLPRVGLPRDLPRTTAPALAVLAGTADRYSSRDSCARSSVPGAVSAVPASTASAGAVVGGRCRGSPTRGSRPA